LPTILSIRLKPKAEKELEKRQEKRKRLGYPQVGTKITAIKSGKPEPKFDLGSLTKGKTYLVVDNLDLLNGYFHVPSDCKIAFVRLTPRILREYFGITLKENPSIR